MQTATEIFERFGLSALAEVEPQLNERGTWEIRFSQGPACTPVCVSIDRAKWLANELRNIGDSDDANIIAEAVDEAQRRIKAHRSSRGGR